MGPIADPDAFRGIALTDDEVVALGVRSSTPWPSPVPTVNVTDAAEIRLSASRGSRSLLVRGLLSEDPAANLKGKLEDLVRTVLEGELVVATYLVDASLALSLAGVATAGYSMGGEDWIAEIIAPAGIHYLQGESDDGCLTAARDVLDHCFRAGPDKLVMSAEGEAATFACVLRRRKGANLRMVAVRQASVAAVRQDSSDAPVLEPLESLAAAHEFLHL